MVFYFEPPCIAVQHSSSFRLTQANIGQQSRDLSLSRFQGRRRMHIDSFRVFALIYIAFTQRERRFTSRDGRAMKIGRAGSSDRRRLAAAAPEITFSHFARAARSYYPLALIAFAAHQITGLQVPVSLSAPARLLYRPRPARTGGCLERHMQ